MVAALDVAHGGFYIFQSSKNEHLLNFIILNVHWPSKKNQKILGESMRLLKTQKYLYLRTLYLSSLWIGPVLLVYISKQSKTSMCKGHTRLQLARENHKPRGK